MDLKQIIVQNLKDITKEAKRIFHGRGGFYENYSFLTVDSFDKTIFACFFEVNKAENEIISILSDLLKEYDYENLIIQRRYKKEVFNEVIIGDFPKEEFIFENDLKFKVNYKNQNLGLFLDMKKGREYIASISKDKKVLNLFSYTCAFSVYAKVSRAKSIVNIDMAKNALTTGRENHHINSLDTKNVKFLPHNILKSWSRIRKFGPYDVIVIDPPSFQRGSFAATKDYEKIIKKLDELANKDCIVLSCLNAPELDTNFMINLFKDFAPSFIFEKRVDNLSSFPSLSSEKSLKNLIFIKK